MHLRLLETPQLARRARGPRLDPWITLSAWMWMAYLAAMCGALLWWLS